MRAFIPAFVALSCAASRPPVARQRPALNHLRGLVTVLPEYSQDVGSAVICKCRPTATAVPSLGQKLQGTLFHRPEASRCRDPTRCFVAIVRVQLSVATLSCQVCLEAAGYAQGLQSASAAYVGICHLVHISVAGVCHCAALDAACEPALLQHSLWPASAQPALLL